MSTRATAFSRRTGKIQQDFDDIATVQRPAERTNKFYNLLKNIVSSVKNFGMKDRFKKYKAKSPDKKHKNQLTLYIQVLLLRKKIHLQDMQVLQDILML